MKTRNQMKQKKRKEKKKKDESGYAGDTDQKQGHKARAQTSKGGRRQREGSVSVGTPSSVPDGLGHPGQTAVFQRAHDTWAVASTGPGAEA